MSVPRKHLAQLKPYPIPVKPDDPSGSKLYLDANENIYDTDPAILTAAQAACVGNGFYPDSYALSLREGIAEVHDINPDNILCARGAMELISLLATAFLEPGVNAVVSEFGYLYFKTATNLTGAECISAPEQHLTTDINAILEKVNQKTRLVFIANPANPSGTLISNKQLSELRQKLPDSTLLVIDEAYAEYADPAVYKSNFNLVNQGNTIILRTFSKIYGLAGFRVGWGVFPTDVANTIRIIHQPNAVSMVSQAAALAAIRQQDSVSKIRERNRRIRDDFAHQMKTMGISSIPSHTNFLLAKFASKEHANSAYQWLRDRNIMVRPTNSYHLYDYLRITMGNEMQMQRVVESINEWKNESPGTN
ncbi:MAG: aminotransferase class I/II-fold pyridoxal phosphate-dependent enzyme [Gammaproteobacteria bacterium]|nr:aminotransferase class I/II-fold pyridoxal phosphate-dependent enzyme [Gammaproteobacteria bacterium]